MDRKFARVSLQTAGNRRMIALEFQVDRELNAGVRSIPGARWDGGGKRWLLSANRQVMGLIRAKLPAAVLNMADEVLQWEQGYGKPGESSYPGLMPETSAALEDFRRWMEQKRYSGRTVMNYGHAAAAFFRYFSGRKPEERAAIKAGIRCKITLHTLRHSYETHLLEAGTDIRYIQELPGHSSTKTTMVYTHVSTRKLSEIKSPFDDL